MLNLDDGELEIALVALGFFQYRAKHQVDKGASQGCSEAAWFSTKYFLGKSEALIARIEQHQKDKENGDV